MWLLRLEAVGGLRQHGLRGLPSNETPPDTTDGGASVTEGETRVAPSELNRPVVSVDFDGTIFDAGHVYYPRPEGRLFPGVRRALMLLKANGFDIAIYTARDARGIAEVWRWLHDHDLSHYVSTVTPKKPKGHVVLFDNAAIRVQSKPNGLLDAVQAWLAMEAADKLLNNVATKLSLYREATR